MIQPLLPRRRTRSSTKMFSKVPKSNPTIEDNGSASALDETYVVGSETELDYQYRLTLTPPSLKRMNT